MNSDAFDGRIVDVSRARSWSITLAELVKDMGFARSTVVIHQERLGTEGLLLN